MTKERLRRYRSLKLEEEQLKEQQNSMETRNSKKLQEFYRKHLDELTSELLAIELAISTLDATARTLLRDYYINGLTWERVAEKNHYSEAQCHRIHSVALIALKNAADRDN